MNVLIGVCIRYDEYTLLLPQKSFDGLLLFMYFSSVETLFIFYNMTYIWKHLKDNIII